MFEKVRASLRELLLSANSPADRRAVLSDMKETLVRARLGVDDVRGGLAESRRRLEAERTELETVRRRRDLAAKINDAETVAVAERFERQHAEHVEVLAQKVAVQERELEVLQREVAELGEEFRRALAGVDPAGPRVVDPSADPDAAGAMGAMAGGATTTGERAAAGTSRDTGVDGGLEDELARVMRDRVRASRDAEASARLDELKRRMGR